MSTSKLKKIGNLKNEKANNSGINKNSFGGKILDFNKLLNDEEMLKNRCYL